MSKKRVFISFAIEDKSLRDFLVGQAKNENSPFEFVDIGVCQHSCRINYFSILKDSSNLKFNQATALRLLAC